MYKTIDLNRTTCSNRFFGKDSSLTHQKCTLRASFSCENARVGLLRDTFARLPTARNNEPVIGILGRVCISIQDVVASIDVTFQSNSPFASFHDLHFPSAFPLWPLRQFQAISAPRRSVHAHKRKLAPS